MVQDVNDHCPVISNTNSYYFNPDPVLRMEPLQMILASDLDSGANGEIKFQVSEVKQIV